MEFPGKSTANAWRHAAILLVVCLAAPLVQLRAQPELTFKRISVNWPTIELYYSIGCNGNPVYDATREYIRITDNGMEVRDFTLWCPDPTIRCAISVALVLDASGSMAGAGNAGAKQAGHAFVDMMDGIVDEAAVLWFNETVTVMQPMTTDKTILHSAVDLLPVGGMTAAWDGAYAGLLEVINNGSNNCRAVILLTDGADGSSTRTPDEIIALANRHRIRVFTVGLGSGINSGELERIATTTGGRYYQTPNAGQLAAIYMEITTIMFQGWNECLITYQGDCADGALRSVELQLNYVCNGSASRIKTYRAPLDSTTYSTLHMELGTSTNGSGMDMSTPLLLLTPVEGDMFYPFQCSLEFDTAVVELRSATTPYNSLLSGVPVSWTPTPTGATIQTAARKELYGTGTLLELNFRTKSASDSACTELKAVAASFEQGCFVPVIADGKICIDPGEPIIRCTIGGPSELFWARGIQDYYPNPFTIDGRFTNYGDTEALNPRYTITYDSTFVHLYTPGSDTKPGSTGVIAAGSFESVFWKIIAKRRAVGDTTRICVTASFDNHPDVVCCLQVYIPLMEPILSCRLYGTEITADSANLRYTPMPFMVTLEAWNLGPSSTDSVWATIDVPMDLDLAGPDTPHSYTKLLSPPMIGPTETAGVSWQLLHPRSDKEKEYFFSVLLNTANADSTRCYVRIIIPGLPVSTFPFTLTALEPLLCCEGDSVLLDAGAGYASYRWSDGSRGRILAVKKTGHYSCKVEHGDGSIGTSDTVRVSVIWNPTPRIAVHGSLPLCENDSVRLDAGGAYAGYLWSTGETTQTITVRTTGAYFAQVRSSYDCVGYSDTVLVTKQATPSKPVISRNLDRLIVTGDFGAYYWYRNGALLPDSGYSQIRITETGSYQVRVRFANGCSATSDPFEVTVLGTNDVPPVAADPELSVWPEPATDLLRIAIAGAGNQSVTVALYDMLGRSEVLHSGVLPDGGVEFTHSLHNRGAGVYYLVAMFGEAVLVKRVTRYD